MDSRGINLIKGDFMANVVQDILRLLNTLYSISYMQIYCEPLLTQ